MNTNFINNIIFNTTIFQIYNDLKLVNRNTNYKLHLKLLINLLFLLISFFIIISCNNGYKNKIFGLFISFISAPIYIIFKLLNPSLKINPNLCLNINFQDRILSAIQN